MGSGLRGATREITGYRWAWLVAMPSAGPAALADLVIARSICDQAVDDVNGGSARELPGDPVKRALRNGAAGERGGNGGWA
jgi:hypothetical protein